MWVISESEYMSKDFLGVEHTPWLKAAINYTAAILGIGTFLGLVNLAVGALSALWLSVQLYGYIRYELPIKRFRHERARRAMERQQGTDWDKLESDE